MTRKRLNMRYVVHERVVPRRRSTTVRLSVQRTIVSIFKGGEEVERHYRRASRRLHVSTTLLRVTSVN